MMALNSFWLLAFSLDLVLISIAFADVIYFPDLIEDTTLPLVADVPSKLHIVNAYADEDTSNLNHYGFPDWGRITNGECTEEQAIDEFPCGQDMFEMTHDGTSSCFHVRRDLHGDYDRCYAFCAKLQNHYNSVMFDANSRSKMWRISYFYCGNNEYAYASLRYDKRKKSWMEGKKRIKESDILWYRYYSPTRPLWKQCALINLRNGTGLHTMGCGWSANAVCEAPSDRWIYYRPTVHVSYHAKSKVLYAERDFNITCHGLSANVASMRMKVRELGSGLPFRELRFGKRYFKLNNHHARNDRCKNGYNITVTDNWSIDHPPIEILCLLKIYHLKYNRTKTLESRRYTIKNIRYGPRRPIPFVNFARLSLIHIGKTLRATCSAYIGYNGSASLAFIRMRGTDITDILESGVYTFNHLGEGGFIGRYQWPTLNADYTIDEANTTYGPRMNITLSGQITPMMNNTQVICYTYTQSAFAEFHDGSDPFRAATPHITAEYGPNKPILKVKYSVPIPYIEDGSILEATCEGGIGYSDALSFVLHYTDRISVKWMVTHLGDVYGNLDDNTEIFLNKEAVFSKEFGYWTSISMRLRANWTINNTVLACTSSDNFRQANDELTRMDTPILIKFLPLEPELNVMFHAVGGVVYENRILQANCTAFVGTFGHMTWVLKMRPILTWVINSDGGIIEMPIFDTDEVPWGFDVYSFYALHRRLGPFIDSQFSIGHVNFSLDSVTLECYSYYWRANGSHWFNSRKEKESPLKAKSLPFRVQPDFHIPAKLIASIMMVILLAMAIWGAIFMYRTRPPSKAIMEQGQNLITSGGKQIKTLDEEEMEEMEAASEAEGSNAEEAPAEES